MKSHEDDNIKIDLKIFNLPPPVNNINTNPATTMYSKLPDENEYICINTVILENSPDAMTPGQARTTKHGTHQNADGIPAISTPT